MVIRSVTKRGIVKMKKPGNTKQLHSDANSASVYQYTSHMSRRDSIKWLGVLSTSLTLGLVTGCGSAPEKGHWPQLNLKPITAEGYGTDPNMIIPAPSYWPKTLTADQLTLVAVLSDIIVPREGDVPSATEVNVPDVIDEWVSAPYERQQQHRLEILSGLQWIDDESQLRFKQFFVDLSQAQKLSIIDDIAYDKNKTIPEFSLIVPVFANFRNLVLAAFFCSPEGTKDIGYMGNVPIAGDYPGPTEEALAHLKQKLEKLNLT